jgi:peptidoglycan/LPS O-acetylase OafA/YrhL
MRKAELPALTGIRFYFAFFVFFSHVTTIPGMETFSGQKMIFNAGVVGVSCFFVLSGFILTYNYAIIFRQGVSAASYKRFVWDRWTKIYPVHFAMLLMMIPIQVYSPNLPLDWRAIPFHLFLTQCFWPFSSPTFYNYLNVPSWSISCEWFFYLVAPFAIYLVLNQKQRWIPVWITAGYVCLLGVWLSQGQPEFRRLYLVSWFAPSRFPEFLTGVFAARMFLDRPGPRFERYSGYAQVAGIVLIVAGAMYRPSAPWPFWGGWLYVPGVTLLVLGLAHGRSALTRHLSRPLLKRLGMASFSLYLMQAPLIRAVKGICVLAGLEVRSWIAFWAVAAGMFLLVQGAAWIMHDCYELPLQRRLRQWVEHTPATGRPVGYAATT